MKKLRNILTSSLMLISSPVLAETVFTCKACPTGTWNDGKLLGCQNCLTEGVASCSPTTGQATSCKAGYGFTAGGQVCAEFVYEPREECHQEWELFWYRTVCYTVMSSRCVRYSEVGSSCKKCSAGTYSAGGTASCTSCPAGSYSGAGASSCTSCPAGTYSSVGASSCTSCSAGTYSGAGASSCTSCPAGQYQPYPGQASCYSCSGSTYQPYTGQTSCYTCSDSSESCSYTGTCTRKVSYDCNCFSYDCNCKTTTTCHSPCNGPSAECCFTSQSDCSTCSRCFTCYKDESYSCSKSGSRTLYYRVNSNHTSCDHYSTGSCS